MKRQRRQVIPIISLFLIAFLAGAAFDAAATGCQTGWEFVKKAIPALVQQCKKEKNPLCDAINDADKSGNIADLKGWVNKYNTLVDDGWGKVGARSLILDNWADGNIVGSTGRLFTSPAPVGPGKSVRIKIKKEGGKNKAGVAICTEATVKGSKRIRLAEYTVDKDAKNGIVVEHVLPASKVEGKLVFVHIDGKKVVGNFDYEIMASFE